MFVISHAYKNLVHTFGTKSSLNQISNCNGSYE